MPDGHLLFPTRDRDFHFVPTVDEKEEKILKISSFHPQANAGPGLPMVINDFSGLIHFSSENQS